MQITTLTLPQALLALALSTLPVLAAQAADAPVETVVVKAVARFEFDGATIMEADRAAMMAEVAKMSNVTWQTITAVGHTDSVGPSGYNQRLSNRRAAAVKSYLLSKGLDGSMVRTQGKGPQEPIADNTTEDGRALNRRAEIQFQGIRGAAK